jgi:hypothetical protein
LLLNIVATIDLAARFAIVLREQFGPYRTVLD